MKESKAAAVKNELLNSGWYHDHDALTNIYKPAGAVSTMRNRGGCQWCRLHYGIKRGRYQITEVYRKPLEQEH